jgi:hypothetical protein
MSGESMKKPPKHPLARAILTDLHFWLPAGVLALGLGLLFFIARV